MADDIHRPEPGHINKELTKAFKLDPTIENYVRLRRANPDENIEVSIIGGYKFLSKVYDDFVHFGLNIEYIDGLIDGKSEVVGELALTILEKMVEARDIRSSGATHLSSRGEIIPDKLIDWIITFAIDSLSWNQDDYIQRNESLPRDLIVLIRERLGGANPQYEIDRRVSQSKLSASIFAGQLVAQGVKPTLKLLANNFNVSPSTVKRWFDTGELIQEAHFWSRLFDNQGNLRASAK